MQCQCPSYGLLFSVTSALLHTHTTANHWYPTVEGFNALVNDLMRLNTQLKKPKDESDLAETYITATRDSLGEIRSCKSDVKRDALQDKRETNSWSDKKWLDAVSELITDQITDMEDDPERAASTARALAARQKREHPSKNRRQVLWRHRCPALQPAYSLLEHDGNCPGRRREVPRHRVHRKMWTDTEVGACALFRVEPRPDLGGTTS